MKILIAADGSAYTKRMLAFIAAHDEWLGPHHSYTVLHCVPAIPHRAAAFVGKQQVQAFYEDDAEIVFKPIRSFFKRHTLRGRIRPPYRFRRPDDRKVCGPTEVRPRHPGHSRPRGGCRTRDGFGRDEGGFALQYSCTACSVDPIVGGAFMVECPGLAAAKSSARASSDRSREHHPIRLLLPEAEQRHIAEFTNRRSSEGPSPAQRFFQT